MQYSIVLIVSILREMVSEVQFCWVSHDVFFFFFNDTATTEIYTLSLTTLFRSPGLHGGRIMLNWIVESFGKYSRCLRSEEHTSELQSQSNLVCRLLLEKKKTTY